MGTIVLFFGLASAGATQRSEEAALISLITIWLIGLFSPVAQILSRAAGRAAPAFLALPCCMLWSQVVTNLRHNQRQVTA
jgi:hypothetical protein